MLVGIHKDVYDKREFCVKRYKAILDYNGIKNVIVDSSSPDFLNIVSSLDFFIFRWNHTDYHRQLAMTIITVIQNEIGVKCFPDLNTCWHFDDKIRQYYLLKYHGFPIIHSWVFWEKQAALNWVETADYPVVFKLKGGAGSQNVVLVKGRSEARRLVKRMFECGIKTDRIPSSSNYKRKYIDIYKQLRSKCGSFLRWLSGEDYHISWMGNRNYALFQQYLPKNDFDTRVTVIGDRAFAFRRLNRDGDFRSSGSGKISYDTERIDLAFVKLAFEVSKKLNFQSMAYDFLYDEQGKPNFCEISYSYDDVAVFNCSGYWDSALNWHEGHFWPEYCHLIDLLGMPSLKQPLMDL